MGSVLDEYLVISTQLRPRSSHRHPEKSLRSYSSWLPERRRKNIKSAKRTDQTSFTRAQMSSLSSAASHVEYFQFWQQTEMNDIFLSTNFTSSSDPRRGGTGLLAVEYFLCLIWEPYVNPIDGNCLSSAAD